MSEHFWKHQVSTSIFFLLLVTGIASNNSSSNKNNYQLTGVSLCQMAEHALSQELLCSDGGRSVTFLRHQVQLQLLRADYSSAAASLKEALFQRDQVLTHWLLAASFTEDVGHYSS